MSFITCRDAIASVLSAYSGAPPIVAENITPARGVEDGEWARWSIRPATAFDADIGAVKERIVGTLYFQHFVNEGDGTKPAWAFCDKIGAMLNRKKVPFTGGLVTFERALCAYIGTVNGKAQHNITLSFRSDAIALNAA